MFFSYILAFFRFDQLFNVSNKFLNFSVFFSVSICFFIYLLLLQFLLSQFFYLSYIFGTILVWNEREKNTNTTENLSESS